MNTKSIGDYGEKVAAEYLEDNGYIILKRNFRIRGGEIDIIAKDEDGRVIFAEVKTRSRIDYGTAAEYVTASKRERLIRTALAFTGRADIDMRFDIIEVYYTSEVDNSMKITKINHIENAFCDADR